MAIKPISVMVRAFPGVGLAATLAGVVLAGVVVVPRPAAADTPPQCQAVTRTVTLSDVDLEQYRMAGWLCWRGTLTQTTVQVLVHGLTYDHHYWDFPTAWPSQSYVAAATAGGYATFAIDRIGDGISDRPLDASVLTTESAAHTLYQVVEALRTGAIGGTAFGKVVTVGHSFGSQVVAYEAGKYHDVDGVILSGSLHQTTTGTFTTVLPQFYPAQSDAKFGATTPVGYLTTIPGSRGLIFYDAADAAPAVVTEDEQLKQTATDGEVATITNGDLVTGDIAVPVLLAVGQFDALFCDRSHSCADSQAVLAREAGDFSAQACLEAYVLPGSGHSMNLHVNAGDWFSAALTWSNRRVGTRTGPPAQSC